MANYPLTVPVTPSYPEYWAQLFKKITASLVNETLKFQMLISQICQYFLLKKCEKFLQCKSFSHFFNKKYQCFWL